MIGYVIIISVGMNNLYNVFLNGNNYALIRKKYNEYIYKKMLFIYLIIMATLILLCNEVKLLYLPMSVWVLVVHITYMLMVNIKIKPYR
jgi:hypothetical protein